MLSLVDDEVRFAPDLYRGSAGYYDRYRLAYPEAMITDLVQRAGVSGRGRLLDLACGTGQLAFPLRRWFTEVWAVDSEPDMVKTVRAKAAAAGAGEVRPVVSSAETLHAQPGYFELAVIGNAFHRLDRDLVAGRVLGWLEAGGHLALCWSSGPWTGEEDWRRALAAAVARWRTVLGAEGRVPAGWDLARQRRPDAQVLSGAGFEAGRAPGVRRRAALEPGRARRVHPVHVGPPGLGARRPGGRVRRRPGGQARPAQRGRGLRPDREFRL